MSEETAALPDLILHLQQVCKTKSVVIDAFCDEARHYLAEFRPTSTYLENGNLGIQLSNKVKVVVSPPVSILQGSMAHVAGQVVPISPFVPDSNVTSQGAVLVTTGKSQAPVGAIDYNQMKGIGLEDRTAQQKIEVLDQPGQYARKL